MQQLYLSTILLAALLISACAGPPKSRIEKEQEQQIVIARWHRCLEQELTQVKSVRLNPQRIVDAALFACQGHKEDVLATFPSHLEKSLNKILINQAYEAGLAQLDSRRGSA